MNTISARASAAVVIGARHLRAARNGQDAAAAWMGRLGGGGAANGDALGSATVEGGDAAMVVVPDRGGGGASDAAVVVVCDGCGGAASSEVGARLGAQLVVRSLVAQLHAGARPGDETTWAAVRRDVARALARIVDELPGDRETVIHDQFLFTIVAAAVAAGEAAVWALGDGAYWLGGDTHVLGPFADNQPPYLAYDLLGEPSPAHLEVAPAACEAIVIATDGATELPMGLAPLSSRRFVEHPDALRRHLAVLARVGERIDWTERCVVRTPALLQDDCAIGVLRWGAV